MIGVFVIMKKFIVVVFTLIFLIVFSACTKSGTTNNVEIDYGESQIFDEDEINTAMDAVINEFRSFNGCDLKKLYYDEEKFNKTISGYMKNGKGAYNGVEEENVIILFSDFYVSPNGGDVSFNKDFTYTNWNWILIRSSKSDKWEVVDWGY